MTRLKVHSTLVCISSSPARPLPPPQVRIGIGEPHHGGRRYFPSFAVHALGLICPGLGFGVIGNRSQAVTSHGTDTSADDAFRCRIPRRQHLARELRQSRHFKCPHRFEGFFVHNPLIGASKHNLARVRRIAGPVLARRAFIVRGDDVWFSGWYFIPEGGMPFTLMDLESTWIKEHPGMRIMIEDSPSDDRVRMVCDLAGNPPGSCPRSGAAELAVTRLTVSTTALHLPL